MELAPGEEVIYDGHPSWRSTIGFYLKGILLALVAGSIVAGITRVTEDEVRWGWVSLAVTTVLVLGLVIGWLKRISTHYAITTNRIQVRRGILARRVEQARVDRVQDLSTSQTVLQRLLRVGSVDFDTAGSEGGGDQFRFEGVGSPQGVIRAVDEAQAAHSAERRGQEPL